MFTCLDRTTNELVEAHDEYDISKIFYCPNPNCNAQFKLKSVHGYKRKHFYRFKGANKHITKCPCISNKFNAYHKKFVEDFTAKDILTQVVKQSTNSNKIKKKQYATKNNNKNDKKRKIITKTTKSKIQSTKFLYEFCNNNKLTTKINDNETIHDIFVTSNNVHINHYKGFEDTKLLSCLTNSFYFDSLNQKPIISCKIDSPTHNRWLNIKINLPYKMYDDCILYFKANGSDFNKNLPDDIFKNNINRYCKNFPIAILAEWQCNKRFHVFTTIENIKQIIFTNKPK